MYPATVAHFFYHFCRELKNKNKNDTRTGVEFALVCLDIYGTYHFLVQMILVNVVCMKKRRKDK